MKKVALSALAAAMISGVASADALTLYSDPKTGQVYTTPGEGRVEMGDFVSAKEVDMQLREVESKSSEYQDKMSKYVNVKSKAKTLEFSGTHYFGLTSAKPADSQLSNTYGNSTGFELRRNYVQVKGFFNDKDYWRVTLDATKELSNDSAEDTNEGYAEAFVKYAYLYLDEVLPYTGVEFGIAHRPWIDYEEHNAWHYRSFNKVLLEEKNTATESGVDLVNSADLGVNFKTKMDMFSSEIGIFNGEGYHADKTAANQENSEKLSLEWRLTAHLLGSGKKVGKNDRTKDTYANLSTYGLISHNHKDDSATIGDPAEYDRSFYGIHAVYNQPEFLIAAQYFKAEDDKRTAGVTDAEYTGWSINAEYRPIQDWTVIARYDDYKKENKPASGATTINYDGDKTMVGLAYKMNKNVSFIGSAKYIDEVGSTGADTSAAKDVYMFTTEVKW
ncbi:MAG: hypothetical protein A2552_11070 [Sulfuricurvum sp. RIFOXYD2_FULL_44_160]|uniref:Porin n=1 Tax=Sulfuricurvum kujiense TaxID=148813 RepID=A0A2D3WFC1_9BACT|nr:MULTISPECIES: hypothetical protein [Sulfuricurvum]OHD92396.1 MAG: hypothetical protein A2552_11070 [Sulfuricurvum sp. RIFOXYD2_FULL_44_160]OHD93170.1 MAG: hypothetical protein A2517_04605 [Sulfuricurvum sp. RIFOXYD12_FULL_44_77]DAB38605.1 MAG TPA: hypothetical protein CFH83_05200 [Sulfuricurvum kujiense]